MGNLPNKFGPIVPRDGDLDEWKWAKLLPPGHFFGTCIYQPFSSWWFGTWISFFHILGMSSSQLTNSIIVQRGRSTTNQFWCEQSRVHFGWTDPPDPSFYRRASSRGLKTRTESAFPALERRKKNDKTTNSNWAKQSGIVGSHVFLKTHSFVLMGRFCDTCNFCLIHPKHDT